MSGGRPAVFLDKDGTLIHDVPFNVDPALVRLMPGAAEGLGRLRGAGFALVVVSNQPGIGLGLFGATALEPVWERLRVLLEPAGAAIAGFYFCPHPAGPDGRPACPCRKPAAGLLLRAAAELGLDLGASWMVGDILDDVEAGRAAGCRTLLIDNGGETEWRLSPARTPHAMADDLAAAAVAIVEAASPAQEPVAEERQ
jgi:histidinol-phosphate phosphatase family protein